LDQNAAGNRDFWNENEMILNQREDGFVQQYNVSNRREDGANVK